MNRLHKWTLSVLLMLFGLSLLVPGIKEMIRMVEEPMHIEAISQINQLRALYGMMAGLGLLACVACINIDRARLLVIGIGLTLVMVVAARLYSLLYDGFPGGITFLYLVVETILAFIFLLRAPPDIKHADEVGFDDHRR